MKIKTLIIGLGNIGMLYDFKKKNHYNNHCESVNIHPNFELLGGVDINKRKNQLFEGKYNLPSFNQIYLAYKRLIPELIIISTPTASKDKIYKLIMKKKILPKAFLIEKPGSYSYKSFKKFSDFCKKKKILVYLNYPRSYSETIKKLAKIINNDKNEFKSVDIVYKNGFFNSCSHYINFLFTLFRTKNFKIISFEKKKKSKKDFLINCNIIIKLPIRFISASKNIREKIIFYGKKVKIIYVTEYSNVFILDKNKAMMNNDFDKNLKNVFDKIFVLYKKKKYFNLEYDLNTLKLLNSIEVQK